MIPNKIQVENTRELTDSIFDAAKPNRLISEYCAEIGLPCLDLLPVMADAHAQGGGPLYFPIDRHFTPKGYALAADALFDFLVRSGALHESLNPAPSLPDAGDSEPIGTVRPFPLPAS